jgi:hypothetical protein
MQPRTPRSYALAVPHRRLPEEDIVPLYMDIRTLRGGATVDGVAQAHAADLKVAQPDAQPARCAFGLVERRSRI